jgi:DNA-binding transcriptional regulator YiaG
MTFACLSEAEVREKYRRADDKEYMIEVLAGLTGSTHAEVRAFLGVGAKRKRKISPPTPIDGNEARRLYDLGLCDREMAEGLGVQKDKVRNWRRRNGLPCNPEKKEPKDDRMKLYEQGLTDIEIGKRIGLSKNAIWYWRNTNNLPANRGEG